MKGTVFNIIICCLFINTLHGQITGKVYDSQNLNPIYGATVIFNDSLGTTTDVAGYFTINQPLKSKIIVVSFLGYENKIVNIKAENKFVSVGLTRKSIHLQSVYVKAGMRNYKLMKTPASLTVLSKKELNLDQGYSIEPLLNTIPGVKMHTGTYSTNRITIRGIGSRSPYITQKVRAYINNIPLTNGSGESILEDIDVSQIGKIEIIKGPSSGYYGAGLGGSIHLFTPVNTSNSINIKTENSLASFGTLKNVFSTSVENISSNLFVNIVNTHSDGYRQNNEFDRKSAIVTSNFYRKKTTINFLGHYTYLKAQIPSSIDELTYKENPRAAAANWLQVKGYEKYNKAILGVHFENKPLTKISINTGIYTSFLDGYESRPANIDILDNKSWIVGIKSYLSTSMEVETINISSDFGIEYFMEDVECQVYETNSGVEGDLIKDNAETRIFYNTFYQTEIEASENFSINLSINANSTNYRIDNRFTTDTVDISGKYIYNPVISPRLGVVYSPTHELSIYALISHGFSHPTLEETLYPNGSINLDIKPEQGINYETGFRGLILKNSLFLDISLFSMHIKNLLVAKRIAEDAYMGVNAGKTVHNGVELFVKYTPEMITSSASPFEISANITIADYKFSKFEDEGNIYDGNKIPGIAPLMMNSGIKYTFLKNTYASLYYYYSDKMPVTDDNTIETDPYQLLNAKLGYRKTFDNNIFFEIFGGVKNILDTRYASMILINAGSFNNAPPRYYYPGLPRNYYVGLKLGYEK